MKIRMVMLYIILGVVLVGCSGEKLEQVQKEVTVNNIKVKEKKELYNESIEKIKSEDWENLSKNYFLSFGEESTFLEKLYANGLKKVIKEDFDILLYSLKDYYTSTCEKYKEEGSVCPKVEDLLSISQGFYKMKDGSVIHDIIITDNTMLNYTVSIRWVGGIVDKVEIYRY